MEVIGGAVNVLSLCDYIIRSVKAIKDTFDEFEDLPQSISEQTRYLNGLASIIDSIARNRVLHTDGIVPHLQLIQDHIKSLQDLLADSFQRVHKKTIKSFSHALFNRGKDKQAIEASLGSLERDKSNLNLFIITNFGQQYVQQPVDMNGSRTSSKVVDMQQLRAREAAEASGDANRGAFAGQGRTLDNSSENNQVSDGKTAAGAWADERSWGSIEMEEAKAKFGDVGARQRTSGYDKRKWDNIKVKGSEVVFGDDFN